VLGKKVRRSARLDNSLNQELLALAAERDEAYQTVSGKTMCTDDFYEGQVPYHRFQIPRLLASLSKF
jgi:uridine phosphorylase